MRHFLMRLHYFVFAIAVAGTLAYGDSSKAEFPEAVFLIGYPDGRTEGFGLSEASYHSYAQTYRKPIVYRAGKSKPKDWPFIHPSSFDTWAGGRAHAFTIQFDLPKITKQNYYLHIGLVDTWQPSEMTVTCNDQEISRRRVPKGSGGTQLAYDPFAAGKPTSMTFEISSTHLQKKNNKITITLDKGSWIIYDYVYFGASRKPLKLLNPKQPELLNEFLAGPMKDVEEIVFACRQLGPDGHWYANFGYFAEDTNRKTYRAMGRLCKLSLKNNKVTILLDDEKGTVRDPQVHYNGQKIIFSYRKGDSEHFHLYEMDIDGKNMKQLTDGPWDDIEPTYVADGGIIFCSSRCNRWVNCWLTQVAVLYRCDANGKNVRQLSSNGEHENTPWPLPDGRILYQRWEYVDRSQVHYHHLWTMNPDGTGQMVYFGNMHPGTVMIDAKPIPDSQNVLALFSPGHGRKEHAGAVTIVSPEKGPDDKPSARRISRSDNYRDPYPFSPDCFLVAKDDQILVMNGQGQTLEIYRLPDKLSRQGVQCHEPRPIHRRERERLIQSRIELAKKNGRLILADVYQGRNMEGIKQNEIKKLLILESLPKPINYTGGMDPLSYGGTFTLERVLGTVPVNEDGSAYLEVPANRSLIFVALDQDNNSLKRMQSFCTVMPGETTSCVGCHEQRTQTPLNKGSRAIQALKRPPSKIQPIEGVPEVFDFPRDIQPILDKHCIQCHDYDNYEGKVILTGDRGPMFSHSYYTLTILKQFVDGRNDPKSNLPPRYIGATNSPIMQKITGEHYDVKLSPTEINKIRFWIESGAPYPGTYGALGSGMIGGYHENHQVFTDFKWKESRAAEKTIQTRCASCHKENLILPKNLSDERGISFWRPNFNDPRLRLARHSVYNLSRPEKSLMLLAPLAKEAGGYEICIIEDSKTENSQPKPVFENTKDPNYQAILAMCQEGKRQLEKIKRFDMPDFQPPQPYIREMQRYGVLPEKLAAGKPIDVYAIDRAYWRSLWYKPVN